MTIKDIFHLINHLDDEELDDLNEDQFVENLINQHKEQCS